MSERMLHRNIKLSTTPPSPSQQYSMTCSNITTSAAAQSAGHQLSSKDRTCNWTLHSKDQQLERGSWSLPFHQSSERKGSADRGASPAGPAMCSGNIAHVSRVGAESQACSPSAECPTSGSVQGLCVQLCIPKRRSGFVLGFGEKIFEKAQLLNAGVQVSHSQGRKFKRLLPVSVKDIIMGAVNSP